MADVPLISIIDCNNFYVECERVFQPRLERKPVVVLSNNDANVIARSNEAKALGITMGAPVFKLRELFDRHGVEWFSSNYDLYGDMSARVTDVIASLVPALETYSIDESFAEMPSGGRAEEDAHAIRETVKRWTGIGVSIGVAPTKTLAKVANKIAKSNPRREGVVDLSAVDADQYLKEFDVSDLWGIGPSYTRFLKGEDGDGRDERQPDLWSAAGLPELVRRQRIETAFELKNCPDEWVRKHLTVRGLRLVRELRGVPCLPLEVFEKPRKSVCCSRSFGRAVTKPEEMRQAVAMHAANAGAKLRRRRLAAGHLTVFISTSRFKADPEGMFAAARSWRLPSPTAYTPALVSAAETLLGQMFREGYDYHKAGVLLSDITPDSTLQRGMLPSVDQERHERLMAAVDQINRRHGRHTVRPLSMGYDHGWGTKRQKLSPRFTTSWDEMLVVGAGTERINRRAGS